MTTAPRPVPAQIGERVATAPLFGGGCVAVVTDPGPLVRSKDAREAHGALARDRRPGNALVFLEPGDAGDKRAAMLVALEAPVAKAGGDTKSFPAPKAGELAGWLRNLAKDRGIAIERDASARSSRARRRVRERGRRRPSAPGDARRPRARQARALPPGAPVTMTTSGSSSPR